MKVIQTGLHDTITVLFFCTVDHVVLVANGQSMVYITATTPPPFFVCSSVALSSDANHHPLVHLQKVVSAMVVRLGTDHVCVGGGDNSHGSKYVVTEGGEGADGEEEWGLMMLG